MLQTDINRGRHHNASNNAYARQKQHKRDARKAWDYAHPGEQPPAEFRVGKAKPMPQIPPWEVNRKGGKSKGKGKGKQPPQMVPGPPLAPPPMPAAVPVVVPPPPPPPPLMTTTSKSTSIADIIAAVDVLQRASR